MNPQCVRASFGVLLLIVCAAGLRAQQAIVNMPSADITPKGQGFLMHETQWRPWGAGSYWYGTNFFTYGVGKNTEVALTTYNAGTPAVQNQNVGFGFKSAIPLKDDSSEKKLTVGSMAIVNYRGQGVGNFSYTHYSFRLPKVKTRLTMGGWFGTHQLFKKNTGNFLGGVEHPLSKKVILLTEWFAGNHDFGFVIPGVLFHPTPRQMIVVAYKMANDPRNGKNGLVIEYGFFFGGKDRGGHH
jgi:hypothetical protein